MKEREMERENRCGKQEEQEDNIRWVCERGESRERRERLEREERERRGEDKEREERTI